MSRVAAMNRAHASAGRASAAGSRSWGLEICARASARARSTRVSARPRGVRALAGVRASGCVQQGPPVRSLPDVSPPGESALFQRRAVLFRCARKRSLPLPGENTLFRCRAKTLRYATRRKRLVSLPGENVLCRRRAETPCSAAGQNRAVSPPRKTLHFAAHRRAAALFPAQQRPRPGTRGRRGGDDERARCARGKAVQVPVASPYSV